MRRVLILLFATAFCASSVICEESTEQGIVSTSTLPTELQSENVVEVQLQQQTSELIETNIKSAEQLFKKFLEDIQQLELNVASHRQQLEESKQQATVLQAQQQSDHTNVVQLQQQVSKLSAESVKAADKHNSQDKDYEKLQQVAQQLQASQKIQELEQKRLSELVKEPAVQWVKWSSTDAIPRNAVYAGDNWDNIPMYVGRTNHSDIAIVVKACPTIASAYFSYFGKEMTSTSTEVLTGSGFSWKWGSSGSVPDKAFPVGKHSSGSLLYIGRAHHPGDFGSSLTPGTVVPGNGGALYVPFNGKELRFEKYQVLVHD